MPDEKPFAWNQDDAPSDAADADALTRVQCPNCCRLAFVVRRSMGLLFYRCELCGTVGAMPETTAGREENEDQ